MITLILLTRRWPCTYLITFEYETQGSDVIMEACEHTLKCAVDIISKLMKISLLWYLYIKVQTGLVLAGFGWGVLQSWIKVLEINQTRLTFLHVSILQSAWCNFTYEICNLLSIPSFPLLFQELHWQWQQNLRILNKPEKNRIDVV